MSNLACGSSLNTKFVQNRTIWSEIDRLTNAVESLQTVFSRLEDKIVTVTNSRPVVSSSNTSPEEVGCYSKVGASIGAQVSRLESLAKTMDLLIGDIEL